MIFGLYRLQQANAQVDISPLQHGKLSRAHRLDHLDLYVRPALCVHMEESGKHTVEHLRCRRHPKHAVVSSPEQLTSLAERADCTQNVAAFHDQLLSLASQNQATANAIEQPKAELLFQVFNLSGEC